MKHFEWIAALIGAAAVSATADTLTLQQGAEGYSGCSDTYISRHYATMVTHADTATTLRLVNGNYQWLGSGW